MATSFIFDLDGTLFDSTEANITAYTAAFKALDLNFDAQKYKENFGLRFNEMMDVLAPHTTAELRLELKKKKATLYKENVQLVKPNTGLISLVKQVHETHKTALVTTASKKNVDTLLNHFIPERHLFDSIITGEDVIKSKPDPEAYIKAIKAIDAKAIDCIVFEDSDIGCQAAIRAGAQVIKVCI